MSVSHGRLTGRQNYRDAEVAALIAELEANDGAFDGMQFYGATTVIEWEAIGANKLGNELQEAANRIGGLGQGIRGEPQAYGPSGREADRDRLRNAIYLALIAYVDHFPTGRLRELRGAYLRRPHAPVALLRPHQRGRRADLP